MMNNTTTTTWDKYPENSIEFADIMKLGFEKEESPDDVWLNQYGFDYFLVYRNIGDFTLDWDIVEHNVKIWYGNSKVIFQTGDIKMVELYISILENIVANKKKVDDVIKEICEHGKNIDDCIRKADTCFDCVKEPDRNMTPLKCLKMLKSKIDTAALNKFNYVIETSDVEAINEALITSDVSKENRKLLYNFLKWLNKAAELDLYNDRFNYYIDKYLKEQI